MTPEDAATADGMHLHALATLMKAMRDAQKTYFRTREAAALRSSKRLEGEADAAIELALTEGMNAVRACVVEIEAKSASNERIGRFMEEVRTKIREEYSAYVDICASIRDATAPLDPTGLLLLTALHSLIAYVGTTTSNREAFEEANAACAAVGELMAEKIATLQAPRGRPN